MFSQVVLRKWMNELKRQISELILGAFFLVWAQHKTNDTELKT